MKESDITLVKEKHAQLDALLPNLDADAWLVLSREQSDDSTLLFSGIGMVGESAFLFTRSGQKYAVIADYDVAPIEASGQFEVIPYGREGFLQPLGELLDRVAPQSRAPKLSEGDPLPDGRTVGLLHKVRQAWQVDDFD